MSSRPHRIIVHPGAMSMCSVQCTHNSLSSCVSLHYYYSIFCRISHEILQSKCGLHRSGPTHEWIYFSCELENDWKNVCRMTTHTHTSYSYVYVDHTHPLALPRIFKDNNFPFTCWVPSCNPAGAVYSSNRFPSISSVQFANGASLRVHHRQRWPL